MHCTTRSIGLRTLVAILFVGTTSLQGLADQPPIAGSPTPVAPVVYIDPGEFLPAGLRRVTAGEDRALSLNEIIDLVRRETGLHVVFDERNLKDADVSGDAALSWLGGVPLYVALDHACQSLSNAPLSWYVEDGMLFVSLSDVCNDRRVLEAYDITQHLKLGMTPNDVKRAVVVGTFGNESTDVDGTHNVQLHVLGNVLHVRTSPRDIYRISSLLRTLLTPGSIRYFDQTPGDERVRKLLSAPSNIELPTVAINELPSQLAGELGTRVVLDEAALQKDQVNLSESVAVQGLGRPLWRVLTDDRHGLVPNVSHGFLSITTVRAIRNESYGAVYDVSDLLPQQAGANAFEAAIELLAWSLREWGTETSLKTIDKAGLLVAWCDEARHRELQQFLAAQRDRSTDAPSPEELAIVETRYYRLREVTAADLLPLIPDLIVPESWRNDERPNAVGVIHKVALGRLDGPGESLWQAPSLLDSLFAEDPEPESTTADNREKYAALIIRQTRRVHARIGRLLEVLLNGDPGGLYNVAVPTGVVPLD
jgi:hypothetical protein